ncbi:MAG: response regulator transcription factor [Lachnospiraceae bacterium]|nr:response regulator transcription factor [Lachnospiraceae bacterium]
MYQILLVEDDPQIREVIEDYFSEKGKHFLQLHLARDGYEGLHQIQQSKFDLVLLDIMMPGLDGFALCREIRQKSMIPIVFLTAKNREEDLLYGYQIGCDDYIVKPFSIAALYAKVEALLKRSNGLMGANLLQVGNIRLMPATYEVTVEGTPVLLPPKEYALLKFFMEHKGQVLSRDMILDCIWGYSYTGTDRVVDNHIKKLRKALGKSGALIKTVITRGYRMEEK